MKSSDLLRLRVGVPPYPGTCQPCSTATLLPPFCPVKKASNPEPALPTGCGSTTNCLCPTCIIKPVECKVCKKK